MPNLKEAKKLQKELKDQIKTLQRHLSRLDPQSERYAEMSAVIEIKVGFLLLGSLEIAQIEADMLNNSGFTPN